MYDISWRCVVADGESINVLRAQNHSLRSARDMVGKPRPAANNGDGDLFPRGPAPGATPRVKKRDGGVLFGPPEKRPRDSREGKEGEDPGIISAVRHGAALSHSRLSVGMTVLCLVTKAERSAVEFALPSGLRAVADPEEVLVQDADAEVDAVGAHRNAMVRAIHREMDDISGDAADASASGTDEEDEGSDDGVSLVRPIWQVLEVGAIVRAAVVDMQRTDAGRKRVCVSLKPDLVNVGMHVSQMLAKGAPVYAAVRSVEDHGYILTFGSAIKHTGFLPFSSVDSVADLDGDMPMVASDDESLDNDAVQERRLFPGTPLEVVLDQDCAPTKKGRKTAPTAVRLTAETNVVRKALTDTWEGMNYQGFRAGMRIKAKVAKSGGGGVVLVAFGLFNVAVDALHVPRENDGSWAVEVGKQVAARILYVDAAQKRIGATLLDSYVSHMTPRIVPASWKVGTIIPNLVVDRVESGYGLILRCAGEPSSVAEKEVGRNGENNEDSYPGAAFVGARVPVFAHVSRVSDNSAAKLETLFHKGLSIPRGARVVSMSRFDGIVNVDLRESILARAALNLDEVQPGRCYDCKIISHTPSGSVMVAVDGDTALLGVIPAAHVSDASISAKRLANHPLLRIGATVRCLALSVNEKRGKVVLTARRSLVKPSSPVLVSYEQAAAAVRAFSSSQYNDSCQGGTGARVPVFTGTIATVTERCGVLVVFCDNVKGLVHYSELCLDAGKNNPTRTQTEIEAMFPAGQTVQVRVSKVDSRGSRMHLSMNLRPTENGSAMEAERTALVGNCVTGRIIGADENAKHFVVSVVLESASHPDAKTKTKESKKSKKSKKEQTSLVSGDGADSTNAQITCLLPYGHLADVMGLADRKAAQYCKILAASLSTESSNDNPALFIPKAMIFSVSGGRTGQILLTQKPSMMNAEEAGLLPSTFGQVSNTFAKQGVSKSEKTPGATVLRGFVKAVLPNGALVGFLGDLVGYVRKSRIADHFVGDVSRTLSVNQSVAVAVESVDADNKRFNLSLRLSDIGDNGLREDTISVFKDFDNLPSIFGGPNVQQEFKIGAVVEAQVDAARVYGTVFNLTSSSGSHAVGVALDSKIADPEAADKSLGQGTEKKKTPSRSSRRAKPTVTDTDATEHVRILDIDPYTGVADVSRDDTLIQTATKKMALSNGKTFTATILLVKSAYVILSVPRSKSRTVIAFALLPVVSEQLTVRPGASVQCTSLESMDDRVLVVVDWAAQRVSNAQEINSREKQQKTPSVTRDSVAVGMKVRARVTADFSTHVHVSIAPALVGQIHASNVKRLGESELASYPLGLLRAEDSHALALPSTGSIVRSATVVALRKPPDGARASASVVAELAIGNAMVDAYRSDTRVEQGQRMIGFVKRLSHRLKGCADSLTSNSMSRDSGTILVLTPGLLAGCHDVDALFPLDSKQTFTDGSSVMCMVTRLSEDGSRVNVAMSQNGAEVGAFFDGLVQTVSPGNGLRVSTPWLARPAGAKDKVWGFLDICDIADDFDEVVKVMESAKIGDRVRVRLVNSVDSDVETTADAVKEYSLTMRKDSLAEAPVDPLLTKTSSTCLKEGSKVRGFVRKVGKNGCFVGIGRGVTARVLLCDLADSFVKVPEEEFPVGKLVQGIIGKKGVDSSGDKVPLVLRKRPRAELKDAKESRSSLEEGVLVHGEVSRVEKFGALVKLSGGVMCLLHKSEADQDRFIEDPFAEWVVGQKLHAIVIGSPSGKVRIGTKRCYFEAAGLDESRIEDILEGNADKSTAAGVPEMLNTHDDVDVAMTTDDGPDDSEASGESDEDADSRGSGSDSEDNSTSEADEEKAGFKKLPSPNVAPLALPQDFTFGSDEPAMLSVATAKHGIEANDEESADDSNNNDDEYEKKAEGTERKTRSSKDKRDKKRSREAAEREIRLREEALASSADAPETADDFERMLVGEPNSSVLWIRYMAFCLSLSQVDKARAVAERALETVSVEKELERVNLWIAYVNLEASYGAMNSVSATNGAADDNRRDAAVFRVFDRACARVTDVKDFHLQVAAALRSSDEKLADEVMRRALRQFKHSKQVWIAEGTAQFSGGNLRAARRTLERALSTLEKSKQVPVILKFAQLEYKHGSAERGRTVFESLVGNFPKRLDLWNVYLDMETKQCRDAEGLASGEETVASARRLFERCVSLDMSSKKMKFAFKKWLSFEKEFGDKKSQTLVKSKAREYVEKSTSTGERG